MFLIADTTQANPPYYLVSGELAIQLQDPISYGNLQSAGIPLIQMSPQNVVDLATVLAPPS